MVGEGVEGVYESVFEIWRDVDGFIVVVVVCVCLL